MRFIEGETLKAYLKRGKPSSKDVARIIKAVGGALVYAHGQKILHRDIKPSNVILTPTDQIYLTDFGLARIAEVGESTLSRDMMVGTPQYISPEQASGETKLDARTDVYSLGVVLYELLVGRVPFQADTPYAVVHDHIFTPLPLPRSIEPDLPESLERVLLKALAKDPKDRFQGVEEMMGAFQAALEGVLIDEDDLVERSTITVSPPAAAVSAADSLADAARSVDVSDAKTLVQEVSGEEARVPPKPKRRIKWPYLVAGATICIGVLLGLVAASKQEERAEQMAALRAEAEQLLEEARVSMAQGDIDQAMELYQQALETDPLFVPAYLETGDVLVEHGETEMAHQVYEAGLEINPDDWELRQRAAEISLINEKWDQFQEHFEWMKETMPDDPVTLSFSALAAMADGVPCGEVRPEIDQALRGDPELPIAQFADGMCHRQENRLIPARNAMNAVLENPRTSPALRLAIEQQMLLPGFEVGGQIADELRAMIALADEIPRPELRQMLKDLLNDAAISWQNGAREEAVQIIMDGQGWVEEHRDQLGDPLADELAAGLDNLLRMSERP
jgi:tetratricopeptide (TPR) repeat protein